MLLRFENETEWLKARTQDVTSTEIGALFGLSPYKSRLRLWHEKKGDIESDFEDNPFTKWGRRLQNAVAQGISEDEGWSCQDLRLYYARDPVLRMGSSFDFKIDDAGQRGMLEVKIAEAFREEDGWLKETAPLPYEFQLQTQLHLARKEDKDIEFGVIGALGKRQSTRLYRREYDVLFGEAIEEEVSEFWASIEANEPPDPDYVVDGELLEKLRGPIRVGDVINLSGNERACSLLRLYEATTEAAKIHKKRWLIMEVEKKEIKNELHDMMGRNETAIIGDFQISAKEQFKEDSVTYGSSFRRFDIKKRRK